MAARRDRLAASAAVVLAPVSVRTLRSVLVSGPGLVPVLVLVPVSVLALGAVLVPVLATPVLAAEARGPDGALIELAPTTAVAPMVARMAPASAAALSAFRGPPGA